MILIGGDANGFFVLNQLVSFDQPVLTGLVHPIAPFLENRKSESRSEFHAYYFGCHYQVP